MLQRFMVVPIVTSSLVASIR